MMGPQTSIPTSRRDFPREADRCERRDRDCAGTSSETSSPRYLTARCTMMAMPLTAAAHHPIPADQRDAFAYSYAFRVSGLYVALTTVATGVVDSAPLQGLRKRCGRL